MKKITLAKAWDYVTPEKTVSFTAGDHEVSDEIAKAAADAGVTGKEANGDGSAATGASGAADAPKGK